MTMILWFIIRNIYLVFIPVSGRELLNPWNFLNSETVEGVFCYVNEVTKDGGW